MKRKALSIVLHTHMPYVEGFGTWPFGEEWLWESIATSYLPLIEVLGRFPGRVTLSVTPVLCDQFEADINDRFRAFVGELRRETHARDIAWAREHRPDAVAPLENSLSTYEAALRSWEVLDGDLISALRAHIRWTSAATHAILPLLATSAGLKLQITTGIESYRRRFGDWHGGFWLPECAYSPTIHNALVEGEARAACCELTSAFGIGDERHLRPIKTDGGILLVPIDRTIIDLVWGGQGYPSQAPYRESHRRSPHDHCPWAISGQPYDPERARDQLNRDARDFVSKVEQRVADGGLCVCALDTELLGHWWFEGVDWLESVLEFAEERKLEIVPLDRALQEIAKQDFQTIGEPLPTTSWGKQNDLSTWSSPPAHEFAWTQRRVEIQALAHGYADKRALRELLALQSSDWAFLKSREMAGDYPERRFDHHLKNLGLALRGELDDPSVRQLAPIL